MTLNSWTFFVKFHSICSRIMHTLAFFALEASLLDIAVINISHSPLTYELSSSWTVLKAHWYRSDPTITQLGCNNVFQALCRSVSAIFVNIVGHHVLMFEKSWIPNGRSAIDRLAVGHKSSPVVHNMHYPFGVHLMAVRNQHIVNSFVQFPLRVHARKL